MISEREIPIRRACPALSISRSAYYNSLNCSINTDDAIRNTIREVALEFPKYGYRRITKALHRKGISVNHKKVLRIMRESNLLCKPKKRYRVTTTNSNHNYPIYPNLAKDLEITSINQLWVADITYVCLLNGHVYLAVILDAFSRKCVGWALDRNIDAQLTLNALDRALFNRAGTDIMGLIHHSDQGVQYAATDYTNKLKESGIKISMSRRGNPYDNAFAESFIKTLKAEEVYLKEYKTIDVAHNNIRQFIEAVYNKKRLHSSIGYLPPDEFEAKRLNNSLS